MSSKKSEAAALVAEAQRIKAEEEARAAALRDAEEVLRQEAEREAARAHAEAVERVREEHAAASAQFEEARAEVLDVVRALVVLAEGELAAAEEKVASAK